MLKSQHFHQPQMMFPLNLPKSRMCTPFRVMHVQWISWFQSMSLCIFSQNVGNILDVNSPVLAAAMLWLGGEKSQMISLSVGGVSSAKTHVWCDKIGVFYTIKWLSSAQSSVAMGSCPRWNSPHGRWRNYYQNCSVLVTCTSHLRTRVSLFLLFVWLLVSRRFRDRITRLLGNSLWKNAIPELTLFF